ncbi:MAG TPA: ATPase domain-containing protein [Polyangiaceae bacterium]
MKNRSPHSSVTKMLTGIQGFDEITDGGLPRGRTTLVMGGPGSGKTVFAVQLLVNGARRNKETALFVAFEESAKQIISNAATFGWELSALRTRKKLFFLDARLSPDVVKAGEFDLIGMLGMLRTKAEEIHATRIVFDGIDVLLGLLDDPVAERREIYRIRDWLTATGLTGIITQKVGGSGEPDQRYGFLQFMVDCVVVLRHQVTDGSAFRNLRVVKYRGSGFSGDEFPVTVTAEGAQGKVLMGVARWEWEQEERAKKRRTLVATDLKRLQLELAQAEAAARLQVVQTEMEARSAEIAVLADATGSASELLVTHRAMVRRMRRADDEERVVTRRAVTGQGPKANGTGAR